MLFDAGAIVLRIPVRQAVEPLLHELANQRLVAGLFDADFADGDAAFDLL
jgi:hypothetical protein